MTVARAQSRVRAAGVVAVGLAFALASGGAPATERFKGVTLLPASGDYLAVRDTPVLEAPAVSTESKGKTKGADKAASAAVGDIKKGESVEVFGKSGAWLAVRKDGKPLGFVPVDALAPLLDGALDRPVTGSVAAGGYACRYTIRFEGRTEVEMGPGRIADYDAAIACEKTFSRVNFDSPMFMSEIPHQGGVKPVYQITLDVVGASPDPDQAFSTILFYDRDKGEVALETAFPPDWLGKKKPAPKRVADVAGALAAAVEIALAAWGPKPWETLAKSGR